MAFLLEAPWRGQKWQLAADLFDEMLAHGLRPTASAQAAVHGAAPTAPAAAPAPAVAPSGTGVLYSKGALCTRFRAKDAVPERLVEAAALLRSGGHMEETLSYTTALRNCHSARRHLWDSEVSMVTTGAGCGALAGCT